MYWKSLLGIILFFLGVSFPSKGQSAFVVSGEVTDAGGEPVIGVTVQLLGTTIGTITDIDGQYQLSISRPPGNYQLQFSFVGYSPETRDISVEQNGASTIDVTLSEDLIGLNEIVITGTSVATSKKQLGNAISTVSGKEIQDVGAIAIDQALAGKVAGALIQQNSGGPAGGISVRLRGVSTLAGSSDPLYIVDGVIVNNSSAQLIDIGGAAQNRLVDLNPNDIERIEVIKGAAAAAIYGSRANNGVVQIFTKRGSEGKPRVTFSTNFRINEIRKKIGYNDVPFEYVNPNDLTDMATTPVTRYDYQDDIFRTGIGTDNYVSVSGGSNNTKYFISTSYLLNQGIVKTADFQRYGARIRLDQVLNDWASISFGSNFVRSESTDVPNGGMSAAYGALTGFSFTNNISDPRRDPVTGQYPSISARANHLEVINEYIFGTFTNRYTGDLQINLTPVKGLGIDYVFGVDTYTSEGTAFIPKPNTSGVEPNGFARKADNTVLQINNDITIRYQTEITPDVVSTTSLGGTLQYDRTESLAINSNDLPPFVQIASAGNITGTGDFRGERVVQGAYLQQTFGLWDKIYLTGAIRMDASSLFAEDERIQYYPKVSGSYLLSEEGFWQNSALGNAFNLFKLRASYGEAGNLTGIGTFERFTNLSPTPIAGLPGLLQSSQRGTIGVRPERQKELEFGIDLALFNSRLGVEFTYYNKEVEDLLLNRTLAPTTGFTNTTQNVGTLDNTGFEVLVQALLVQTDNFRWNLTGTFSANTNEINGIEEDFILLPNSFGQSAVLNGEPIGVFYTTYQARNPDGSLLLDENGLPQRERVGRDANGQPSGALDEKVIGDPNPAYFWSLINEFDYHDFSFRLQFDAMQGFDVFNFTNRLLSLPVFGGGELYAEELRGDLQKGYNTATFSAFDRHVEDGSFVKLREVAISYNHQPTSGFISNLRFSLVGRNLFSFDSYRGWDPETNAAGQSNSTRGFDFNEVPIPRTYSIGVTATF